MLRGLLLEKFHSKDDDGDLYQQAIGDLERLSLRELKIIACMYFIMTMSIHLHECTLNEHKQKLISLVNEVGILKGDEVEKLCCHGFLFKLFPQRYDMTGLERLKLVDDAYIKTVYNGLQ